MPIFTTIATAIVAAIGITGIAATIVTAVISIGLSIITAKLLAPGTPKQGKDPGVKVQLPPGTDNKVAKLYGHNYAGGALIDAQIANSNKTMRYVLVLSEYSGNVMNGANVIALAEAWTVQKIYRNDATLVFGTGANGHKVQSLSDPNSTSTTTVKDKIRVRVYANGAEATHQVFPADPSYKVTARSMFTNWTASNTMTGLVYAIVEIDYDTENGLTGMDTMTFEITNSRSKPKEVLLDYLTNTRYGAGLTASQLNLPSFDTLAAYTDELVPYLNSSNVSVNHPRYVLDGGLSTFNSVKENLDQICQCSGAFFAYNNKTGQFEIITNRAATTGELSSAFVFTDDNIISSIQISSTELFSLYNQVEIEFPSAIQLDQTDTVTLDVSPSERNPNEPDNEIAYRLDLVNHRARAGNLGLVELRQSRLNLVLQFKADFSALAVNVGEIVKMNSSIYGWTDKLFRVMRSTEIEDTDGMLSADLLLLEYSADVYDHELLQISTPKNASGIDSWWVVNGNALPVFGNIIVVDNPASGNANVVSSVTGNIVGNYPIATVDGTEGGIYSSEAYIQFAVAIPDNTTYNRAVLSSKNMDTGLSSQNLRTFYPNNTEGYFISGGTEYFTLDTPNLTASANLRFDIQLTATQSGVSSLKAYTANISTISVVNSIKNNKMAPYGAGAQFQLSGMVVTNMANSTTFTQVTDSFLYNIRGVDLGKYTYSVGAVPTGTITSGASQSVGIRAMGNITYSNTVSNTTLVWSNTGVGYTGLRSMPTYIMDDIELVIDPVASGLTSNHYPVAMALWVEAYSTLTNTSVTRGLTEVSFNMMKITNESSYDRIGVYTPPPSGGGGGGGFDPGDPPVCLISGQTVIRADGNIALIDDIIVGDELLSYSIDSLPLVSDDPTVLTTWSNSTLTGNASTAIVGSINSFEAPKYVLINSWLKTTPNHRHLIYRDGVWRFERADYVRSGDLMRHEDGSNVTITSVEMRFVPSTAFSMDVEDLDVFYAGNVLTHNVKAIP